MKRAHDRVPPQEDSQHKRGAGKHTHAKIEPESRLPYHAVFLGTLPKDIRKLSKALRSRYLCKSVRAGSEGY